MSSQCRTMARAMARADDGPKHTAHYDRSRGRDSGTHGRTRAAQPVPREQRTLDIAAVLSRFAQGVGLARTGTEG